MSKPECIFCDKDNPEINTIIADNELAYARWDNIPASPGHVEIVPIRHVESFFDLNDQEVLAIYALAKVAKEIITAKYHPDAFNLGVKTAKQPAEPFITCIFISSLVTKAMYQIRVAVLGMSFLAKPTIE